MKTNQWRGCKNIRWTYYNCWADPDIIYNGYTFNYWDVEDALWEYFLEDTGHTDMDSGKEEVEKEFDEYVQNKAESYLEDLIYGGYFAEDSKTWHKAC